MREPISLLWGVWQDLDQRINTLSEPGQGCGAVGTKR
jgi:hypothetical protein